MSLEPRRDIVVVGASAGGVEALSRLVAHLPADLPAAVFIVLHVPPGVRSRLHEILSRRGPLPVRQARDTDAIVPGQILVAPPDYHLVLGAHDSRLYRGPRQNSSRPSIDTLFQSAAASHRRRVVGVVLSGYLDDGAAGLRAIVRAGGVGIAQDPREAINSEMPENAIARAGVKLVLPVDEIGRKIAELAGAQSVRGGDMPEPNGELPPQRPDLQIGASDAPGSPTGITCPECHGVLWIGPDANSVRYHCRVGHTFSLETLRLEQHVAVERALWAAARARREQAAVSNHIASRADDRGAEAMAPRYRSRERLSIDHAEALERILTEGTAEREEVDEAAEVS